MFKRFLMLAPGPSYKESRLSRQCLTILKVLLTESADRFTAIQINSGITGLKLPPY